MGHIPHTLTHVSRGRYRILKRGGGVLGNVLKRGVFAHMRATFFSPLYEFGGPPKGVGGSPKEGGGALDPKTPRGSAPGFVTHHSALGRTIKPDQSASREPTL